MQKDTLISGIYCIENLSTNKKYIGQAKKKIAESKIGKPSSRRNTTPVFCIELNKEFKDAAEAAKELSLDSSAILKVCRKQRKTCGGYTWEFLNIGK